MWPQENIPITHCLYKRIPKDHIDLSLSKPKPIAYKDEELSCDWCEYSNAKQTRDRVIQYNRDPNSYFVVRMLVNDIKQKTPVLEVKHQPEPENRSHTHVNGDKKKAIDGVEIRMKLRDMSHWVIPPPSV